MDIKKIIDDADAILIGVGAGLSTAAGIDYGRENFRKNFPELYDKYHFTDFYSSSFYVFDNEREKWSYWAKHIDYLYNQKAKDTYKNLFKLVKNKNYFVITTNVDGQFLHAGFDRDRVFEVQGTLAKIQCSRACHNKLYDDLNLVKEMIKSDKDCMISEEIVPYCPRCHESMDVNLRKDEFFVQDKHWYNMNDKYNLFIDKYKHKKLVLIELGVGFNTPGIIRFPFESLTFKYKDVFLIRINRSLADVPKGIRNRSIGIKGDCSKIIEGLIN